MEEHRKNINKEIEYKIDSIIEYAEDVQTLLIDKSEELSVLDLARMSGQLTESQCSLIDIKSKLDFID